MNQYLRQVTKTANLIFFLFLILAVGKIQAQVVEPNIDDGTFDSDKGQLIEDSKIENDSESDFFKMIIDETVSKIGRDFTETFFNSWKEPAGQNEYTIIIQEKPLPMNGSQILVYVDDYLVYQNFVQPRIDVIEDNANYAISMVTTYLENFELILQQLQGDDLSGTGIY